MGKIITLHDGSNIEFDNESSIQSDLILLTKKVSDFAEAKNTIDKFTQENLSLFSVDGIPYTNFNLLASKAEYIFSIDGIMLTISCGSNTYKAYYAISDRQLVQNEMEQLLEIQEALAEIAD